MPLGVRDSLARHVRRLAHWLASHGRRPRLDGHHVDDARELVSAREEASHRCVDTLRVGWLPRAVGRRSLDGPRCTRRQLHVGRARGAIGAAVRDDVRALRQARDRLVRLGPARRRGTVGQLDPDAAVRAVSSRTTASCADCAEARAAQGQAAQDRRGSELQVHCREWYALRCNQWMQWHSTPRALSHTRPFAHAQVHRRASCKARS